MNKNNINQTQYVIFKVALDYIFLKRDINYQQLNHEKYQICHFFSPSQRLKMPMADPKKVQPAYQRCSPTHFTRHILWLELIN